MVAAAGVKFWWTKVDMNDGVECFGRIVVLFPSQVRIKIKAIINLEIFFHKKHQQL